MNFTDPLFLLGFVPVVAVLAMVLCPPLSRPALLLLASCLFYLTTSPVHLALLVGQVVWTHFVTRMRAFRGNTALLVTAISIPLGSLILHKYLAFLLIGVLDLAVVPASLSPFTKLLLPVGISFYTFELISYAVDRYRGTVGKPASFSELLLFISFFPHLAAGPILRFEQFHGQVIRITNRQMPSSELTRGLTYLVAGLALKLVVADSLAGILAPLVLRPDALTVDEAVYLIFGFSFRIFFDFYGYSLMAIGIGLLFGIELPRNFNRPYQALNPRDFWHRWHISLSMWIRDYLYLPLGGNRAYIRNILIVFALCGLWHGAGWNFVVWGLYHAVLVIGYRLTARIWDSFPPLLQKALMFVLASVGWLAFMFDFTGTVGVLGSLAGRAAVPADSSLTWSAWALLALAASACWLVDVEKLQVRLSEHCRWSGLAGGALAALMIASLLLSSQSTTFIYFRF